jgi:hypothetical protein
VEVCGHAAEKSNSICMPCMHIAIYKGVVVVCVYSAIMFIAECNGNIQGIVRVLGCIYRCISIYRYISVHIVM